MASKKKLRRKIVALEQIIAEHEERDYARWCLYCEGYKQGQEAANRRKHIDGVPLASVPDDGITCWRCGNKINTEHEWYNHGKLKSGHCEKCAREMYEQAQAPCYRPAIYTEKHNK